MEAVRTRTQTLLAKLLGDRAGELEEAVHEACMKGGAAEGTPMFSSMYASKARQLLDNLDPSSYVGNAGLLPRVLAGEVELAQLPRMTPQELYPEQWEGLVARKRQDDEKKFAFVPQAMTDRYVCHRCKSRKITYYEVQTRSADEGSTQKLTCLDCGFRWQKN